jgi:TctA family transporter
MKLMKKMTVAQRNLIQLTLAVLDISSFILANIIVLVAYLQCYKINTEIYQRKWIPFF